MMLVPRVWGFLSSVFERTPTDMGRCSSYSLLSPEQCAVIFGGTLFFVLGFLAMISHSRSNGAQVHMTNMYQQHIQAKRYQKVGIGMLCLVGALWTMGGCQKTALRPQDTRSQFDQYDRARNQRAQPFLEDEFGRRTPNLSQRLRERKD